MKPSPSIALIRGLRDHSSGPGDWKELVTNAILGNWPTPNRSPNTIDAENGLPISGTPYYFYVERTLRPYVFVIFLHKQVASLEEQGHDNEIGTNREGATPFDSGGLWHSHVQTHPLLNELAKKQFFLRQNVPLTSWRHRFDAYVNHNYSRIHEYICGVSPKHGTPPIIAGPPNESRAWAWEVRYPPKLAQESITLERLYMRRKQRDEYVRWLWRDSTLEDREAQSVHHWLADNLEEVNEQDAPESIVKDHLVTRIVE